VEVNSGVENLDFNKDNISVRILMKYVVGLSFLPSLHCSYHRVLPLAGAWGNPLTLLLLVVIIVLFKIKSGGSGGPRPNIRRARFWG